MIRQFLKRRTVSDNRQSSQVQRRRLLLEPLEARRVLATFVVTNLSDGAGPPSGSLREAIELANANPGADTIEFATVPGMIGLTAGQLDITDDLTINGPGADDLEISGNNASRIFNIDDSAVAVPSLINVEINNLSLIDGSATGDGGAIRSLENLTVRNASITGSTATGDGGGIYARSPSGSTTTISGSTISGNSAADDGGGIYALSLPGSTTSISGSTISGNSAADDGGGIYSYNLSTTTISGSTISGNSAADDGGGIYSRNYGTMTVSGSTISGNSAADDGGGIFDYTFSGKLSTIENSTISGNSADDGGGIYSNNFGTATISGSIISYNSAAARGGGIFSNNSGTATISSNSLLGNSATIGGGIFANTFGTNETTIDDSTISGNSASDDGGGILSLNFGSATISNSTVTGNSAADDGGGIYSRNFGTATISGSTVSGNSAGDIGGGIHARTSTADLTTIDNSTISGNSAGDDGGGIYSHTYGTATISGSTISGNSAADDGGGIFAHTDSADLTTIDNSTISGNSAADGGGGIQSNNFGTATISGSTISGNSAANDGGGIQSNNFGTATLSGSTISGNSADIDGGGVFVFNQAADTTAIVNSTFSGNTAGGNGGGVYAYNLGTVSITSTTITKNTALTKGGGLYVATASSAGTDVTNSIIAGNTDPIAFTADISATSSDLNVDFSLIGINPGTSFGSDNLFGNPMLGPLQNNGGRTETHALLPGSQAIDAGSDALVPPDSLDADGDADTAEDIPFDQRGGGFPRIVGGTVDMGAFETKDPGFPFEDDGDGIFELGVDTALTAGDVTDGIYTASAGLVLPASLGEIDKPNINFKANGDIIVNTNLTSAKDIQLTSNNGSVRFDDPVANAVAKFKVKAAVDFIATARDIILAGQIDVKAGRNIDVSDSILRAVSKVKLQGVDVKGEGAVIEATDNKGQVDVKASGDILFSRARVSGPKKLSLKATDEVFAALATLQANGTKGQLKIQAGQQVDLSGANLRACSKVDVKSSKSEVNVQNATIGILDGSPSGSVKLQAKTNVQLADALIRAPGKIDLKGTLVDEALADIGKGTLPAV